MTRHFPIMVADVLASPTPLSSYLGKRQTIVAPEARLTFARECASALQHRGTPSRALLVQLLADMGISKDRRRLAQT